MLSFRFKSFFNILKQKFEKFSMEAELLKDNIRQFELSPDDTFADCCGKVLITRKRVLVMQCSFCIRNFGCFDDFLEHLLIKHTEDEDATSTEGLNDNEVDIELNSNSYGGFREKYDDYLEFSQIQCFDEVVIQPDIDEVQEEYFDEIEEVFVNNVTDCKEKFTCENYKLNEMSKEVEKKSSQRETDVKVNTDTVHCNEILDYDVQKCEHEETDVDVDQQRVAEKEYLKLQENISTIAEKLLMMNDKKKHKIVKKKSLKCNVCDKAFFFKSHLQKHQMVHSEERNHKCLICNFAFKDHFNLRAHLTRHTKQKNFSCDVCLKKFFTRSELKQHRRFHTGEKPFICTFCGLAYTTSGSLTTHAKKHNPKEAYKCAHCEKCFYGKASFKAHMVVHKIEKVHICDVCGAIFPRRKSFSRHEKLHAKNA